MGGKGKGGGYPWWQHIKSKGGGGGKGGKQSQEKSLLGSESARLITTV